MKIKSITNNTDSVDIDAKCIGLDVQYGKVTELHTNRGLHIQIRHNRDQATFEEANRVARLIALCPEMLEALREIAKLLGPLDVNLPVTKAYSIATATIARAEGGAE